ncbi:TadE/TadG family type IV pilus assembly protein [Aquipuribacter sp. MA13-6]|uniref:TadE/TadG family type IV pilus assembly protein n=1 Tax=unclassified Aquipuribacter TaxID=2635084 RepID=UPI003EEB88E2
MTPATRVRVTPDAGASRRTAPGLSPSSTQGGPRALFRGSRRGRSDEGFGAVELVLLVPAIVLAVLLVVAVGRVEQARLQVTGAARDAARAASLTRSIPAAQVAAQTAADVALSAESVTCAGGPAISVDGSRFEPGGAVDVTVTCTTRLGDVGFPSLPATKTLTATAASPLEQYRSRP